jgi:transposase InsO family protein
MHDDLEPKDHAEAVALFRAQVLGPVLSADLGKRELAAALRKLSTRRYMPPGSKVTRTYGVSTLQRWYYRYKKGGLDGLRPKTRKTGYALSLDEKQRDLIVEIRRAHPSASVPLILETLEAEGHIEAGSVQPSAVRRLLSSHGLDRRTLARLGKRERRRWQAGRPGQLWHADVCHGPSLVVGKRKVPLRLHALLDDASRFVPVIAARTTEREVEMLEVLVSALREHGKPEGLYLDNGPTYVGEALQVACGRLGIALCHARPYDAPARGKMERFYVDLEIMRTSGSHTREMRLPERVPTDRRERAPHNYSPSRNARSVSLGRYQVSWNGSSCRWPRALRFMARSASM